MMRFIHIVVVAAALILLIGACTITPDTYTIATVDDHRITLKDIQDEPGFRQMVDNIAMKLLIYDAASAKGISITKEQVDEEIEEMRQQIGSEEAMLAFLESQGATLESFRDFQEFILTFNELLKSKVVVTDDEVKAEFEMNPDFYRREYAREYDLTVDEVENLTYEDMKEFVTDQLKLTRANMLGESTIDELKANADTDYLYLPPEKRAEMKAKQEKEREKMKPAETEAEEQPFRVTIEEDGSGEEPALDEEPVEEPETSTEDTEEAEAAEESPEEGEDTTSATEDEAAEADSEADETEAEGESSDG